MDYDSKLSEAEKERIWTLIIEKEDNSSNFCHCLKNLGESEAVFYCSALHEGKVPDKIFEKRICCDDLENFCMNGHDSCYFKK